MIIRELATDALREAGIPGIKYLDQFSRFGNIPSPVKDAAARGNRFYGGSPEVAMKQFENRISGLRSARANESLPLRHDRPADPQDVLSLLKSGWIPKQDETHATIVVFNDKLIEHYQEIWPRRINCRRRVAFHNHAYRSQSIRSTAIGNAMRRLLLAAFAAIGLGIACTRAVSTGHIR